MKIHRPRLLFASLGLVSLLSGAPIGAQQNSDPTGLGAIAARAPEGSRWSIAVMDAQTGDLIYALEPDLPLNPASNAKLITAAVALDVLGPDFRFTTSVLGSLRADTLRGPVVLRGQGDPSLRTEDLWSLARELYARGLRTIEGGVLVDDTALGTQHLPPAFEQQPHENAPFRASVSAVSLNDNALTVRVSPSSTSGAPAFVTVDPSGYLVLQGQVDSVEGEGSGPSFDFSAGTSGRELVRLGGSIGRNTAPRSFRRRIENPSLAAGYGFKAALETFGITVRGDVRVGIPGAGSELLASHSSRPLSELVYEVGKESNNFYAEMLLLALGSGLDLNAVPPLAERGFQKGLERVRDWLRSHGIPTEGMVLRNGSGLFDANRVSARQFAVLMQKVWLTASIRNEYVAQLSIAGEDGTLRARLAGVGSPRHVRAKTGTLNDATALSGYVLTDDPRQTLIFSILANGVRGHQEQARTLADQIIRNLAARTP